MIISLLMLVTLLYQLSILSLMIIVLMECEDDLEEMGLISEEGGACVDSVMCVK